MRNVANPNLNKNAAWATIILLVAEIGAACGESPPSEPDAGSTRSTEIQANAEVALRERAEVAPAVADPPPPPATAQTAPVAGEVVQIPAGVMAVGSRPGTSGRDARYEADLNTLELGAFEIDRLPYPNDPDRPAATQLGRAEAAAACAEEGKRLCTELEWERACKGQQSDRRFASGDSLVDCAHGACATPEGVLSMGLSMAEWTSSIGNRGLEPLTVFRGAAPDADEALHRCAARRGAQASTRSPHIGFRCCRGAENAAAYPTEPSRPRFAASAGEPDTARDLIGSIPELQALAPEFRLVDLEGAQRAVDAGTGRLNGWELAPGVLHWSPVPGEEALVITGISGEDAIVAVLLPSAGGGVELGASLVLEGEADPIAVAFTPPEARRVKWGVAWGELGQSGTIHYTEDSRFSIEFR